MSREIKFRVPVVCQNGHKAYWYWSVEKGSNFGTVNNTAPKNICKCPKTGIGEGWSRAGADEQYTGLKDKNGVEIYEGDIVATSNTNPDYDIWTKEEMGYAYVAISPECGVSFQTKTMNWDWDNNDESVYSLQFIEVIGNKYKNPELLEGS